MIKTSFEPGNASLLIIISGVSFNNDKYPHIPNKRKITVSTVTALILLITNKKLLLFFFLLVLKYFLLCQNIQYNKNMKNIVKKKVLKNFHLNQKL